MNMEVKKVGKVTILQVTGSFALGGDLALREKTAERLQQGDRLFILDLSEVIFIDSVGLGETVACVKRARERDGEVRLVLAETGKTREVFTITGVDRAFEVFTSAEDALAGWNT